MENKLAARRITGHHCRQPIPGLGKSAAPFVIRADVAVSPNFRTEARQTRRVLRACKGDSSERDCTCNFFSVASNLDGCIN